MTSGTTAINKSFTKHVAPVLQGMGFERTDPRNGWSWGKDCILVFSIRAVGRVFAKATGWPPSSVSVWLGVYYPCIPADSELKRDSADRLLPHEDQCHMRANLERAGRDAVAGAEGPGPEQRSRMDVWWLDESGSDADDVAKDIALALSTTGERYFSRLAILSHALADLDTAPDGYAKFRNGFFLAKKLGRKDLEERYATRLKEVARRLESDPPSR